MMETAIKRLWTIWEFSTPSNNSRVVIAKTTEFFETEHEYQKILGVFEAYNEKEALKLFSAHNEEQ